MHGIDVCVSERIACHVDVDSSAQQMHGDSVPDRVWGDGIDLAGRTSGEEVGVKGLCNTCHPVTGLKVTGIAHFFCFGQLAMANIPSWVDHPGLRAPSLR